MNKFYVYKDGDSVTKTYVVTNGIVPQTEVSVLFTVPDGLVINLDTGLAFGGGITQYMEATHAYLMR